MCAQSCRLLGCQCEISVRTLLIAVYGASALFIKTQFQAALSPGLTKLTPGGRFKTWRSAAASPGDWLLTGGSHLCGPGLPVCVQQVVPFNENSVVGFN